MQKEIKFYQAIGSAGEVVKASHSYMLTEDYIATSDCEIGTFLQRGAKGKEATQATGKPITSDILGVCVKTNFVNSEATTNTYKAGANVFVLERGQIFMNFSTATKNGQYVFLNEADGSLAVGDTSIKSGYRYTGFRIVDGGQPTATSLHTCVVQDYVL